MRVNLTASASRQLAPEWQAVPVSLLIRPARGVPGDYTYATDSQALLHMLRKKTDLPATVLDRFKDELRFCTAAKLLGVEICDQVLTDIGYFV